MKSQTISFDSLRCFHHQCDRWSDESVLKRRCLDMKMSIDRFSHTTGHGRLCDTLGLPE
ncbi:hypothetical protein HanRHA438_Chr12g0565451 [Helianthus annuus]|nr:hypothetical protein HanRHA438_Chr12g0565451 [Helianthus annuus]